MSLFTLLFVIIDHFIPVINPTSPFFPIYYMRGQINLFIILMIFYIIKSGKINQYSLGLARDLSSDAKTILISFAAVLPILILLFYLLLLNNSSLDPLFKIEAPYYLKYTIYKHDIYRILIYFIPHLVTVLIFSPFLEEILFTGIIYPAFRNKIGILWALVITGLIFTFGHNVGDMIHLNKTTIIRFMIIFPSQLLSFFLYQYTKSLYPSIVYHFFRNLLVTLPLFSLF
ncbi:CPBP family intramembrane metalloprotease [bacterium]|nr:CPBP family intramembrane metalloprotease [bacterium]